MLILLAALIAAGDPGAEFSLAGVAGTRGERRAEVSARANSEDLSLTLGAVDSFGSEAPHRQEVLLAGQSGMVRGELKLVPQSAGLFRIGAEAGVHFESVSLILGARAASLGRSRLRAATARLELEGDLADDLHAGLSAAIHALQLDAPPSRDPWLAWGMSTLDWAQRWDAAAWLSRDFGVLSLAPSLSLSQPAQAGAFEVRAGVAMEVQVGSARLRAEVAAARMWPQEQWMADVTAGIALALR